MYCFSKYFECNCICITNRKEKNNIDMSINRQLHINNFSQIEYNKTISQVYQLKQKLLGKQIKNIETYNII